MKARIGFKLQVTAMLGFHSLYDWCNQMMWLFSGESKDLEDDTVMEMHGAEELYSVVKRLMHAIRTEDEVVQQDVADRMIQIGKPWTIWMWSELKQVNNKPLVQVPKEDAHCIDLEWTAGEQPKLNTLVTRHTSRGVSGAWMVYGWR